MHHANTKDKGLPDQRPLFLFATLFRCIIIIMYTCYMLVIEIQAIQLFIEYVWLLRYIFASRSSDPC